MPLLRDLKIAENLSLVSTLTSDPAVSCWNAFAGQCTRHCPCHSLRPEKLDEIQSLGQNTAPS